MYHLLGVFIQSEKNMFLIGDIRENWATLCFNIVKLSFLYGKSNSTFGRLCMWYLIWLNCTLFQCSQYKLADWTNVLRYCFTMVTSRSAESLYVSLRLLSNAVNTGKGEGDKVRHHQELYLPQHVWDVLLIQLTCVLPWSLSPLHFEAHTLTRGAILICLQVFGMQEFFPHHQTSGSVCGLAVVLFRLHPKQLGDKIEA